MWYLDKTQYVKKHLDIKRDKIWSVMQHDVTEK